MENKIFSVININMFGGFNFNYIKKISFAIIVIIPFALTNCNKKKSIIKHKKPQEVEKLEHSIRYYINKTPNELYKDLGKPALYDIITDSNNQIQKASISYDYVYNFKTKKYDCRIIFFTNKEQNKIVSVAYNSPQCHYIFR